MRIKVIPYNTQEYVSRQAFPQTGESGKYYLALDTMSLYSWGNNAYVSASFRYEGKPTYHGSYLRSGYLEYQVASSPVPIEWHNGDYVRYSRTGRVYKMYTVPQTERLASTNRSGESFAYRNVQFYDAVRDLELVPFRDFVKDSDQYFFSSRQDVQTTEPLSGIVARINANLANYYGDGVWDIVIADDIPVSYEITEAKDVTISGNCLDALNAIYESWHELGWAYSIVEGVHTIVVGYPNVDADITGNRTNQFSYGNGLTALKRNTSGLENFCTRMRVFGTERNLPNRYYNNKDIYDAASVYIPNLMIPLGHWGTTDSKPDANKAYIEDVNKIREYGLITKDVYFDGSDGREEVYPSIEGQTISTLKVVKEELAKTHAGAPDYYPQSQTGSDRIDEIISAVIPQDDTSASFTIKIRQIGFDIAQMRTTDGATISFKSGMCAGRDFGVTGATYNASDDTWTLTCHRAQDNSTADVYPNTRFPLTQGDRFVILGIEMPEEYVLLQAERLYTLGLELFNRDSERKNSYEPTIDSKKVCENIEGHPGDDEYILLEGKYMPLYDEDIIGGDHTAEILIAELTISESDAEIATYRVTLSDKVNVSNTLSGMISDAVQSVSIPDAGGLVRPVYFRGGKPQAVNGIDVPGDIHSGGNIEADGGVSSGGISDLSIIIGEGGGGGGGDVNAVRVGSGEPIEPDAYGVVNLPAYPSQLSEMAQDSTHRTVTDEEKEAWDNKLDESDLRPIENTIGALGAQVEDNHNEIERLSEQVDDKAEKVQGTQGNLTTIGAGGNLEDSGKKVADFATSQQGEKADTAVQPEDLANKGDHDTPVYFDSQGAPQEIDALNVPGNVESGQGVSAQGISDLDLVALGGEGTVKFVQIGDGTPIEPDGNGNVQLPAYPDLPTVVTYANLDNEITESTSRIATAYSVEILKENIGIEGLPAKEDRAYNRGELFKVIEGTKTIGYRVVLPIAQGESILGKVERLTYATLARPLNIPQGDLNAICV